MKAKNLWSAVRPAEDEVTSSVAAIGGEAAGGAEEAVGTGAAGGASQESKVDNAVVIIVASLGDKPLQAVLSVQDDPREMWKRLHTRCSNQSEQLLI